MLYIALVVSAILLLVVNLIAWKAERPVGLILTSTVVTGFMSLGVCLVMLPPVLYQAILVCVAALIWGAIRAARQCLACHDAERGDLLGAFSYRMTLDGKQTSPQLCDTFEL